MTNDYTPIDCDQHSVLELLAMRRAPVRVEAVDEFGDPVSRSGQVADVLIHDRAEFLRIDTDDGSLDLRLDRLRVIFDAVGAEVWRQKAD